LNSPEVRGVRICATLANIETKSLWHKGRICPLIIIFECLKGNTVLTSITRLFLLSLLDPLTPSSLEPIFYTQVKVDIAKF
jgi:hypothetical protein